jgi:pSer/pThr/pTyr-binding forkhead associated (FHA) protein
MLIESYHVGVVRSMSPLVSVGFSSECDIQIQDPSVSRIHAYLSYTDGWRIRDAGSAAGTLVNDEPPGDALLASGDRISLGQVDVLFLESKELFNLIHRLELF